MAVKMVLENLGAGTLKIADCGFSIHAMFENSIRNSLFSNAPNLNEIMEAGFIAA
jgi:hypothetical protein